MLSLAPCSTARAPPDLIVWPEMPAPFYDYDDPPSERTRIDRADRSCRSADRRGGARSDGAPLNSALLLDRRRPAGQPLRQGEPGAVRRVCAVAVRLADEQSLDRSRRLRSRAAGRGVAAGRPQHRHVHLLRIRVPAATCGSSWHSGAEVLVNISNDSWFGNTARRASSIC